MIPDTLSPRSVLSDDDEMQRAVQIGTAYDLRSTVVVETEPANGTSQEEMEMWSGVPSAPVPISIASASCDTETSSMQPISPSKDHHRTRTRDDTVVSPLLNDINNNNDSSNSYYAPPPANGSPSLIRLNSISTTSTKSNNSIYNTGTDERDERSITNSMDNRSVTTAGGTTTTGGMGGYHPGGVIDLRKDPRYRYQLIQKIGEGGYGSVYKAFDNHTSGTVAIKLIDLEGMGDELEEVNQEIAVMSNVHCPQLIKYHARYIHTHTSTLL